MALFAVAAAVGAVAGVGPAAVASWRRQLTRQRRDRMERGDDTAGNGQVGTLTRHPRASTDHQASAAGWLPVILRVAGSGLLIATAAIHLDLYLTGYRTIPTIGWLFLLQVIAAFALGLAVLAIPAQFVTLGRLAAAAGAGFALATLGGYLLSVWIGLFGFKEVRTTAGIAAGVVEVAAFVVLAALALAPARAARTATARAGFLAQIPARVVRASRLTAATLTAAALVLLGVALAGASAPAPAATASGTVLKTATIRGMKVLTNGEGFTVYSFAPDTPTTSRCYGSCAAYWPPVTGKAAAGGALPGKTSTIRRTNGSLQLTYDGHPLYTYIGDTAPGQANGNNLNLNGGRWHVVPASP
jgi:predicted lipoprotein with Yx(FWY)xxD motif